MSFASYAQFCRYCEGDKCLPALKLEGANRDDVSSRKRRERALIADPLDEQLPEAHPHSAQKLCQMSAVDGVLCLQSSGMSMACSGSQPFCVGASPPKRGGHRQALPAVSPPTSMDTCTPQPDTYLPASAAAANLLPTLQMQSYLHDQADTQQAHIGMPRQDSFCNESPSHYLNTLWRQGLHWLADSQKNAQKILVEYEAGHHAVQPGGLTTQHVQHHNEPPMHQEPPLPARDPVCNRGDSMTNSYGQDRNLHAGTDRTAAQAAFARAPLHLPESPDNVVDDADDFDLQSALATSLAQFEMDMLRTMAESLPVKRQNGSGHVWQNEKDPTVIEGQQSSSTAEEVQKLQKASDSNGSHGTPGAQPTSPHTSCALRKRDAGLIDDLNDLSLEEVESLGLDKPIDDSRLTAEVVHRLKALRLERLAAPGGNHGSTLPESDTFKEEADSLMDYWYDSEYAPYEYDQESESECEKATDEVPHAEIEIAMGDWVNVVADMAEAPNGNASRPCIIA
ncbi:TPA: hypothetical protein ACH3X1_008610 [Trebouxia sp. C0004]